MENNTFCKLFTVGYNGHKFQVLITKGFYREDIFELDVSTRVNNRLIGSKIRCLNELDLQQKLKKYDVKQATEFLRGLFIVGAHNM